MRNSILFIVESPSLDLFCVPECKANLDEDDTLKEEERSEPQSRWTSQQQKGIPYPIREEASTSQISDSVKLAIAG